MTTVSLEGRLGHVVGGTFSFNTRTLKEVLVAIEANTGKLRSYLSGNGKRYFAVFVNGKEIDPHASINTDVQNKKILIIPILMGAFIGTLTAFYCGQVRLRFYRGRCGSDDRGKNSYFYSGYNFKCGFIFWDKLVNC